MYMPYTLDFDLTNFGQYLGVYMYLKSMCSGLAMFMITGFTNNNPAYNDNNPLYNDNNPWFTVGLYWATVIIPAFISIFACMYMIHLRKKESLEGKKISVFGEPEMQKKAE